MCRVTTHSLVFHLAEKGVKSRFSKAGEAGGVLVGLVIARRTTQRIVGMLYISLSTLFNACFVRPFEVMCVLPGLMMGVYENTVISDSEA